MAEATELRTKEKAKNEATIADAKAAQEAVKSALSVLKEFYAKAAEATALMQQPSARRASAPLEEFGVHVEERILPIF